MTAARALRLLARLIVLLGTVALLLLAVVAWSPRWLDVAGDAVRQRVEQDYLQRWAAVVQLAASDRDGAREALRRFAAELAPARKQDRLATLVRLVEDLRTRLALQAGDSGEALASTARWVAMDDRDLGAAMARARALAAAGRPTAALAPLERMAAVAPDDPDLLALRCQLLLATGRADEAARGLIAAAQAPAPAAWQVQWGPDPRQSSWFVLQRSGPGAVAAQFLIDDAVQGLSLRLPRRLAARLGAPRLALAAPVALAALQPRLQGLAWEGDDLLATGAELAEIALPELAGPRPFVCGLQMTWHPRLSDRLAALLLGPLGAGALAGAAPADASGLRRCRGEALGQCAFRCRSDGASTAAYAKIDGDRFVVRWRLPAAAPALTLELPAAAGLCYGGLLLRGGDRELPVQASVGADATGFLPGFAGVSLRVDVPAPGGALVLSGSFR